MTNKSHVTLVDRVTTGSGFSWACSCGVASFVTFPTRKRAQTSADWHRARAENPLEGE